MKQRIALIACLLFLAAPATAAEFTQIDNAYGYSFTKDGKNFPLENFRGKVLLVVNSASQCGLTPQFSGLQKLYDMFGSKGLVVIGVPSNDFGGQEPGTDSEILAFALDSYQITFPIVSKEKVSGDTAHPFYKWAARQKKGGLFTQVPRWNFHKYLVDKNGNLVGSYASYVETDDDTLVSDIRKALGE